jgi:presqualene diphosphate phosphatase
MMMAPDVAGEQPKHTIPRTDLRVSMYLYQRIGKSCPYWLLIALEYTGNGFLWILGVFLLLVWPTIGWRLRVFALNLEVGFLLDVIIVGIIKLTVRRTRPDYAEKQYSSNIPADKYSFPSGHASRCIFIAMAVFLFRSMCHRAVLLSTAVWAVATSMSRVLLGRHFLSDIVIGSMIGVLIAGILSKVCDFAGLLTALRTVAHPCPCALRAVCHAPSFAAVMFMKRARSGTQTPLSSERNQHSQLDVPLHKCCGEAAQQQNELSACLFVFSQSTSVPACPGAL